MGDDPNTVYKPGDMVANPTATTGSDDGALGCFATASDGSVVLLSCAHVLFANRADSQNLNIYSPPSSSTCCRHRHIATTLKSWLDGFDGPHTVVPDGGEPPDEGYYTDAAIAKLEPGVLYSNEIPGGIGMIAGTPSSGLGVPTPPAWGTPPTNDQLVRFYSPNTKRVHYGTLLPPPHPGSVQGGPRLDPLQWPYGAGQNNDTENDTQALVGALIVLPRPGPGESYADYAAGKRRLYFGQRGDSGSVVVNSQNQVIGVVCKGTDLEAKVPWKPTLPDYEQYAEWRAVTSVGTLSPIGYVLKKMGITIPANLAKTTPSAGDLLRVALPTDPDELALQRGQRRIGDQLRRSRLGRIILEKLTRHRGEARRIVERNRQAMLAWRSHQGPAFVNHCMHNLRDPRHRVPTAINGVTRTELIRVMADLFAAHGSNELQRDVARYRDLALRYAPVLTSLDDVAPTIAELQRSRTARPQVQP